MDLNSFCGIALVLDNNKTIEYFGQTLKVSEVRKNPNDETVKGGNHRNVPFGCVTLSYVGEALMKIAELHGINKVNDFFDKIVIKYFKGAPNKAAVSS